MSRQAIVNIKGNIISTPVVQVQGIEEVLLIGFYEESEIAPFVAQIQEHLPFRLRYASERSGPERSMIDRPMTVRVPQIPA